MDFAGIEIGAPVIIASGPATATIEQLTEAEAAGIGAVSIKHVMSRQRTPGRLRCYSLPEEIMIFPSDKRLDVAEGVDLIREARRRTNLAIFVNFSSQEPHLSSYGELAKRYEEAGAHALEINMCCPNFGLADPGHGVETVEPGAITGQNPELAAAITRIVKDAVSIPVVPKLTPTAIDVGAVARACVEAGADALSLVGGPSLAAPPVDIYNGGRPDYPLMGRTAFGAVTGSGIRYNTFKVVAQVAQEVSIPITASGGVDTWEQAVQMMMWGADVVGVCTAVMWRGFRAAAKIASGIDRFVSKQGYGSVRDIVGLSLEYLTGTGALEFSQGYAQIDQAKCTNCGACLKPAHCNAVSRVDEVVTVDPDRCIGCGVCPTLCRYDAIEMVTGSA